LKLLIVDDSLMIRARIAQAVSALGLDVVGAARDGAAALRVADAQRVDLVTMDLTMPAMDGIECIRQILARQPWARILVVSAIADKETALRALQEGALGFLCKPFTPEELCDALRELVEGRGG
jgi:two-component system, chemotaxis family, chemotaxis protein CheY